MTNSAIINGSHSSAEITGERGARPIPAGLRPVPAGGRLLYLDGLRGLAALYVALSHAYQLVQIGSHDRSKIVEAFGFLDHGMFAVILFIVLSGFCLMIPVVRSPANNLPGGVSGFLVRRCRRILPAYYGALALSLLLIAAVPEEGRLIPSAYSGSIPVTWGDIGSHLLLVQNFLRPWFYKINAPMWSICVEWQIYFVFALLIIPIWRRFGSVGVVISALLISFAIRRFSRGYYDYTRPFMLTLFTFGMAAAAIVARAKPRRPNVSPAPDCANRMTIVPVILTVIAVVLVVLAVYMQGVLSTWVSAVGRGWIASTMVDLCAGAGFACLLVALTLPDEQRHRWTWASILETPVIKGLGSISYSLYLIHYPLLWVCFLAISGVLKSGNARLAFMLGVALPATIAATYLFYRVAERPFLRTRPEITPQSS